MLNQQSAEINQFLTTVQLFKGISEQQIQALANIAIKQTYSKGETLFLQGDEGKGFFIVISGKVKVFKLSPKGKEQILEIFSNGEHFAEVPAFDGQCFPASATALETTQVLFFPRIDFLELLQKYPNLAIAMLAIFARHLRQFAHKIENLSLKEVPERLAAYLLYLQERHNVSETIELDMTKTQLAAFLGTIPETISRVLAKLSAEKLIMIDGSKITILDRQRLENLAGYRDNLV